MATGLAAGPTTATTLDAVPPRGGGRLSEVWRSGALLAALGGALAGAALFLFAYRGMPDDSYITLDYARNLVEHGHWGLTRFRDANSATSPLNVWLLAAGILVTGRPVVAVGLLLVLSTAVMGVWAHALARALDVRRAVVAGLVVGLVVTSPIFTAVVGMEATLVATLLVGVVRYAAVRRPVLAGVVTGLAVLTRPDLALPAVVVLAVLFLARAPREVRPVVRALAVAVAVALPWHVWSWFVLGSFVPDSLLIKTSGSFPNGEVFGNGPLFMAERWPVPMLLIGIVAVTGTVAAAAGGVRWARGRDRLVDRVAVACALAAVAHYAAYTILGVSSYIWYYAPSLALSTLAGALGAADLAGRRVGAVATGLVLVAGVSAGLQVAPGVPWSYPTLFGNWATPTQYLAAGRDLAAALPSGASVQAPGEIGTLAFGCDCDIVDEFADTDRVMVRVAERRAAAGPVGRWLLDVNYLHADVAPPDPFQYVLRWVPGSEGPGSPTNVPGRGPGRLVLGPPNTNYEADVRPAG